MKIFLEATDYPPYTQLGGGGVVYNALARSYKELGHDVTVIFGRYDSKTGLESIKKYTDEHGIKFIEIPLIPTPKFISFFNSVLPILPWRVYELEKIFKEEEPEFIHLHGYGLFFTNQLAKICANLGLSYTLTLHGAPVSPGKKGGILSTVYGRYKKTLGKHLLDHASDITAVSQYTIDNFTEFHLYKDKIRVIPNGIYPEEFTKKIDYNIYDQYNLPSGSKIFLSIGRIERIKGFDLFIKMIPLLVESGVDVRYFIAGNDNGYKDILIALSKKLGVFNRIYYLGFISGIDKLSMLQYCDTIIVSSLVENWPAVPLEAMAIGKTTIVNRAGGMPEQVINGYNGVIMNFNNIDEYTNIINVNLKKENIQNEVKKYNWSKIAEKYLSL